MIDLENYEIFNLKSFFSSYSIKNNLNNNIYGSSTLQDNWREGGNKQKWNILKQRRDGSEV